MVLTFISESQKKDKNTWCEKFEFMETQYEKVQKELDHYKETLRMSEKEHNLKIKMIEYESQRTKEDIMKYQNGIFHINS